VDHQVLLDQLELMRQVQVDHQVQLVLLEALVHLVQVDQLERELLEPQGHPVPAVRLVQVLPDLVVLVDLLDQLVQAVVVHLVQVDLPEQ